MCSILMGTETFISTLLENFGLNQWKKYLKQEIKYDKKTDQDFHCDVIASSMRLFSILLTNRNFSTPKDDDELLEREVLHFLCALEPISFSKLSKSISDQISKHKNFEKVLNKIATKKKMEGNEVFFVLKPAQWAKYDRLFTHYNQ